MSISGVVSDLNNMDMQYEPIQYPTERYGFLDRTLDATPYALGTLSAAALGTYLAVTATSTALAIASVAMALFGTYGFFVTAYLGIYSHNHGDFQKRIGPALTTTAFGVIAEMIATVAKTVFVNLVNKVLNNHGKD